MSSSSRVSAKEVLMATRCKAERSRRTQLGLYIVSSCFLLFTTRFFFMRVCDSWFGSGKLNRFEFDYLSLLWAIVLFLAGLVRVVCLTSPPRNRKTNQYSDSDFDVVIATVAQSVKSNAADYIDDRLDNPLLLPPSSCIFHLEDRQFGIMHKKSGHVILEGSTSRCVMRLKFYTESCENGFASLGGSRILIPSATMNNSNSHDNTVNGSFVVQGGLASLSMRLKLYTESCENGFASLGQSRILIPSAARNNSNIHDNTVNGSFVVQGGLVSLSTKKAYFEEPNNGSTNKGGISRRVVFGQFEEGFTSFSGEWLDSKGGRGSLTNIGASSAVDYGALDVEDQQLIITVE